MKKAIVSVINDLSTDQRVHKTCLVLQQNGYDVLLVGRKLPDSLPIDRPYKTKRMRLIFKKGPLFYLEFQKRLFWFLLFKKADLFFANDLDTLLPNYLVSKIKGSKLIYDSHEYFTEVPELQISPFKKSIWKSIERFVFPKLKHIITVNNSIAKLYADEYGKELSVVRNVPDATLFEEVKKNLKTRQQLGLPRDKKIVILQGSGINMHRGAEEAVQAFKYVSDAVLLIAGSGDVIAQLKKQVVDQGLKNKVIFKDKMPYRELLQYTFNADLGLTIDKDTNINYRYSLPNKLFDYIHAEIPVLGSDLVEVKNIIQAYGVGDIIEHHDPNHIAQKINAMLGDENKLKQYKQNCFLAIKELCWEKENLSLIATF